MVLVSVTKTTNSDMFDSRYRNVGTAQICNYYIENLFLKSLVLLQHLHALVLHPKT